MCLRLHISNFKLAMTSGVIGYSINPLDEAIPNVISTKRKKNIGRVYTADAVKDWFAKDMNFDNYQSLNLNR